MSGDWIKMRGNLWDDPRVAAIVDATDSSEAAIVGALYWLWATADQHTEDGLLPGLSLRQIDRKTGVKGFGQAVADIGWIEECDDGIRIVRFDEHNGASAKRRASESRRKMSARDADKLRTDSGSFAHLEIEKEKEVKQEQDQKQARKRATPPQCPDDVEPQTWADWLALRKAKRAPVTETVVREARREAAKAGMTFAAFLAVWCRRGSQGLEADWLKPNERAGPAGPPAAPSKTRAAIETLQGLKSNANHAGMAERRDPGRPERAALPVTGTDAGH